METATLVIVVLLLAGVIALLVRLRGLAGRLEASIQEAVDDVVRRQDERIRKRIERADGQQPDVPQTQASTPLQPGQPWPGG